MLHMLGDFYSTMFILGFLGVVSFQSSGDHKERNINAKYADEIYPTVIYIVSWSFLNDHFSKLHVSINIHHRFPDHNHFEKNNTFQSRNKRMAGMKANIIFKLNVASTPSNLTKTSMCFCCFAFFADGGKIFFQVANQIPRSSRL